MKRLAISEIVFAIIRFFVALFLSVGTAYCGMILLDKLTHGIDEWKEIKKGNAAVGIFFASVILSLYLFVSGALGQLILVIVPGMPLLAIGAAFVTYLMHLLLGLVTIYLTVNVLDKMTHDVHEFEELKKGNVAVAVIISVILFTAMLAARTAIENVTMITTRIW